MEISLYQIAGAFPALMNNEELTEEQKEQIQLELTEMLKQKSNNIIGYYKNMELTINAMKEEEERIAENRKTLENKQKRFKEYVKICMENNDITKIDTTLGTLSIAKSPMSVEIINEDMIPAEYKKEVVTTSIDKKAILDNFKQNGEMIEGTNINMANTNLRIK